MSNSYSLHEFLGVEDSTAEGAIFSTCKTCGLEYTKGAHEGTINLEKFPNEQVDYHAIFRGVSHPFNNVPGSIACGKCGQTKGYAYHNPDSESVSTYRKPLNVPRRYDLIPPIFLDQLAEIYEEGSITYGVSAYIEKPMPYSNVVNHLINHLQEWRKGDRSEKHLAKVAWAVATLIVYEELGIGKADLTPYGVKP